MSEGEVRRVRVSGGELSVLDLGDPEDPAVVLLHGFPASRYAWRHVMPLLAPYLRVIAPDLLGAGDSDKPAGADLGLRAQTGYVRELLEALGVGSAAAVGHGLGGGIAQLLALEGTAPVAVLLDPVAFDGWPGAVVAGARGAHVADPHGLLEELVRASVVQVGRLTDGDLEAYRGPYRGDDGAAAFLRFLGALDGAGLEDVEAALERLEVPVMVLWGEEDAFHPPELAERFAEILQMGSVALLPGCGHFLLEDAPETVGPLIFEFLRSRYLGTPHTHGGGPVPVDLGMRPPTREEDA